MTDSALHLVVLETPDGERSVRCREDEYVWDAAFRQGITLPSICHQGTCLTCASRLLSGTVDQTAARAYFDVDKEAGFVLPCTAKPLSDLRLRTHQAEPMRAFRLKLGLPSPYS
jgi:ferredoxin